MDAGASIRVLGPGDVGAYRALRLALLADAPAAFGADAQEEAAQPLSFFQARLEEPPPSAVFGGFVDDDLVGMARFSREHGVKTRHIGWLTGVGVLPGHRGRGLARALVAAVVSRARGHVVVLRAAVGVDNVGAGRVYRDAGFRRYGIEPRALLVDGRYIDEDLLSLDLDTPAS